ncbi:hypothetical protein EVAR_11809_1 [Eumeta japonica]|uniref:Uncharacterized protein n=1 Tax=Eumeta variegata TaxID=151549 RepID=A0A4C1UQU0_EUMVA|nr:hypothetical protein EVAR_11809_1 [Eumeta japonica]
MTRQIAALMDRPKDESLDPHVESCGCSSCGPGLEPTDATHKALHFVYNTMFYVFVWLLCRKSKRRTDRKPIVIVGTEGPSIYEIDLNARTAGSDILNQYFDNSFTQIREQGKKLYTSL